MKLIIKKIMPLVWLTVLVLSSFTYVSFTSETKALSNVPEDFYNTHNDINPRSPPLDTSQWFDGETIRIFFCNGTNVYIQSSYKYNSINNITHQLNIFIDHPMVGSQGCHNITVYTPLHWNFTNLDPSETVYWCSSCIAWEFDFTQVEDTTFNMTFFSGNTYGVLEVEENLYLCIDNITDTYLSDYSFESSYDDFSVYNGNDFTDKSINNTIYWRGSNSFRLENNVSQRSILYLDVGLPIGSYYISMTYHYESIITGSISLYVYDGSAWQTTSTNTNMSRSHRLFTSVDFDGSENGFRIDTLETFQGIVFIDTFEIWIPSIEIINDNTIYYYNISSSLMTWDLYNYYAVDSETVHYTFFIRHNNTLIDSSDKTTNETGISIWNLNKNLQELEYSIYAQSDYGFEIDYDPPIDPDLEVWMELEEGIGNDLNDSSGNGHNATNIGANWTIGKVGDYALDFNDSDYLNFGDNDSFSFTDGDDTPFSISAWIKLESLDTAGGIVSKYGASGSREWICYYNDEGFFDLFLSNPTTSAYIYRRSSSVPIVVGEWCFITVTYDGSEIYQGINIYRNAVLSNDVGTSSGSYNGMTATSQELHVGLYNIFHTDGIIDEVKIYTRVRTQAEIELDYTMEYPRYSQNETKDFTGKKTNNYLFYHQTLDSLDEWDFTEGNNESLIIVGNGILDSYNGTLKIEVTEIADFSIQIKAVGHSINSFYYNKADFVCKANASNHYGKIIDGTGATISNTFYITQTFQKYTLDLKNNWEGTETGFGLRLYEEISEGLFDGDEVFYIEYIRLYHQDTPKFLEYETRWRLNSQNDSYTYFYDISSGPYYLNDTLTDDTFVEKINGQFRLNYTAYKDSLNIHGLILPSVEYHQIITLEPLNDMDELTNFIVFLLEVFILFSTFGLVVLAVYKVLKRMYNLK